jgi:integrase
MVTHQVSKIHRLVETMPRVQKFLSSKRRGAVNTAIGYKTSLAFFQQFLTNDYDDLTLEAIIGLLISKKVDIYDLLDHFVSYLVSIKLSRSSIHQYLTGIRSYFVYYDVDIVNSKFKRRVTMPKTVQEEEQAIDQDDIRNILLKCNNRRLKTYLLVLATSGVRAIEACAIRLRDLDFQHNPTKLHVRGEYTKTKASRDIFISDEATRYLKDWIEYTFKIDVDQTKAIDSPMAEYLVFQVHKIAVSSISPIAIYRKLLSQFHVVLKSAGLGVRKESTKRRRITFHSFRRFVKTTISDSQAGSDYSEWFLGHRKNTYYVSKPAVRAEIYATKIMKYLTYLDYSTLKATGKTMEAKISEMEREKQMLSQKYEQEMKAMQEQIDNIIKIVKDPHTRARMLIKPVKRGLVEDAPG